MRHIFRIGNGTFSSFCIRLSVMLYIASMPLVSFADWPGIGVLAFGWITFALEGDLSWFANPALFVAWVSWKAPNRRLICSVAALFLSLYNKINPHPMAALKAHLGGSDSDYSFQYGYWVWVASIAVACIGAVAMFLQRDKRVFTKG